MTCGYKLLLSGHAAGAQAGSSSWKGSNANLGDAKGCEMELTPLRRLATLPVGRGRRRVQERSGCEVDFLRQTSAVSPTSGPDVAYVRPDDGALSLRNRPSRPSFKGKESPVVVGSAIVSWKGADRPPEAGWRPKMVLIDVLGVIAGVAAIGLGASARVVKQYERGLVFRFGRVSDRMRGPGLTMIVPVVDRLRKVNLQIVTMAVPAQEGITRDNVTVRVDAVVYFRVVDPVRAIVNVEDYPFAVSQVAQTSLRSVIGKSDLDDLLTNRERLNQGLELMIDSPARRMGHPHRPGRDQGRRAAGDDEAVDVAAGRGRTGTPCSGDLRRGRAAGIGEARPGRRSDGRHAGRPAARLLETIVEVAAEKNSTLVLPFPVELLRFLEHNTSNAPAVERGKDNDSSRVAAVEARDPSPAGDRPAVGPSTDPAEFARALLQGLDSRRPQGSRLVIALSRQIAKPAQRAAFLYRPARGAAPPSGARRPRASCRRPPRCRRWRSPR